MLKVTIDDSVLKQKLVKLTTDLNKSASESIIEMAGIAANQLAIRVEPYGTSNKSKTILENAIHKDLNKVYLDNAATYNAIHKINPKLSHAYSAQIRKGDFNKAQEIAAKAIPKMTQSTSDSGNYLEGFRNARGRVKAVSPMNILDSTSLDVLHAKKVLMAGTAKAGWLQAGKSLGAKTRVPKWLKKAGTLGSSNVVKNGWKTVVALINHVRYSSSVTTPAKINAAVKNAYVNQIKKLEKQVAYIASKF